MDNETVNKEELIDWLQLRIEKASQQSAEYGKEGDKDGSLLELGKTVALNLMLTYIKNYNQ